MKKLLHGSEKEKAAEWIPIWTVLCLFNHYLYLFQSGPDTVLKCPDTIVNMIDKVEIKELTF